MIRPLAPPPRWLPRAFPATRAPQVRLLWQYGEAALQPGLSLRGTRRPAMVSRRIAAMLRKKAILQGTFGEFTPQHSDE